MSKEKMRKGFVNFYLNQEPDQYKGKNLAYFWTDFCIPGTDAWEQWLVWKASQANLEAIVKATIEEVAKVLCDSANNFDNPMTVKDCAIEILQREEQILEGVKLKNL